MIIQIWRRSLSELLSPSSFLASVVVDAFGSCCTPFPGTSRFWTLTSVMSCGGRAVVGVGALDRLVVSVGRVVAGRCVVWTGGSVDGVVDGSVEGSVVGSVLAVVSLDVGCWWPPGPCCPSAGSIQTRNARAVKRARTTARTIGNAGRRASGGPASFTAPALMRPRC
jgi:hypothetical protein